MIERIFTSLVIKTANLKKLNINLDTPLCDSGNVIYFHDLNDT